MKSITNKQVKRFAKNFSKQIGFTIITKGSVMWLLSTLARKAMTKYANLVEKMAGYLRPMVVYNFVFLPWKVGCKAVATIEQVQTLVHESVHVQRIKGWKDDGGTVSSWYHAYFTNPTFRATEEALAIAAEAQVMRALERPFAFPDLRTGYLVGKSDQTHAEKVFEKHTSTSGVSMDVVVTALRCLRDVGVLKG